MRLLTICRYTQNGTYEVEGEDMFGNTWTIPVTVTLLADGPKVTMSTLYKTKGDITANIEYTSPVTVTENDGNTFAKIENNGTNKRNRNRNTAYKGYNEVDG